MCRQSYHGDRFRAHAHAQTEIEFSLRNSNAKVICESRHEVNQIYVLKKNKQIIKHIK